MNCIQLTQIINEIANKIEIVDFAIKKQFPIEHGNAARRRIENDSNSVEILPLGKRIEKAKEIMRELFIGGDEIHKAFGIEIGFNEMPAIQFSIKELKEACLRGEILELRWNKDSKGDPLSITRMHELVDKRFENGLINANTNGNDPLYSSVPEPGWVLLTSRPLQRTTEMKGFAEGLEIVHDYLRKIITKPEQLDVLKEFEQQSLRLRELITKREQVNLLDYEIEKFVSKLNIVKKFIPSTAELIYDVVVNKLNGRVITKCIFDLGKELGPTRRYSESEYASIYTKDFIKQLWGGQEEVWVNCVSRGGNSGDPYIHDFSGMQATHRQSGTGILVNIK